MQKTMAIDDLVDILYNVSLSLRADLGLFIMRNAQTSRAFTLIELLVVIAIIAILAAILFPVFAQAKDAAKKTSGLSEVKQINLAYILYSNDYDDTYLFSVTERYAPTYGTANDTAANAAVYSARELLDPYTKNDQIWKNPSSAA